MTENGCYVSYALATIKGNEGLPLTDVIMAILPVGWQTEFTKFFGRPENSAKRDISPGNFSGRDGTPFSLRVIKAYDFEIPLK